MKTFIVTLLLLTSFNCFGAANTLMDWSHLRPKDDFYDSFMRGFHGGEDLERARIANEIARQQAAQARLETQLLLRELQQQRANSE